LTEHYQKHIEFFNQNIIQLFRKTASDHMEEGPWVFSKLFSTYLVFSLFDNFLLDISLLISLLLGSQFPKIIEFVAKELIFIKLSVFDSLFVVKLSINYQGGDDKDEDYECDDDFF
jgi:hypothetical protein